MVATTPTAAASAPGPGPGPAPAVSLGKPSLRHRLESYYGLVAPAALADRDRWQRNFEIIHGKCECVGGGSVPREAPRPRGWAPRMRAAATSRGPRRPRAPSRRAGRSSLGRRMSARCLERQREDVPLPSRREELRVRCAFLTGLATAFATPLQISIRSLFAGGCRCRIRTTAFLGQRRVTAAVCCGPGRRARRRLRRPRTELQRPRFVGGAPKPEAVAPASMPCDANVRLRRSFRIELAPDKKRGAVSVPTVGLQCRLPPPPPRSPPALTTSVETAEVL